MSLKRVETVLKASLQEMRTRGTLKGDEKIITGIKGPEKDFGPRYYLKGEGKKEFLRMNSNSYLGLSLHPDVIAAEEETTKLYGTGPGAVRFISGTFEAHIELEKALAAFHGRESAIIFSSAYSAVMGVLSQLITEETLVISDALNHNCIINAIRLSRPAVKAVYPHLNMEGLSSALKEGAGKAKRAIVVTDGIFSMRGDHAPLDRITDICRNHEGTFKEGIITVADDSHGVGAFGKSGRGTEEVTGRKADVLISTLGKSIGVNGGYAVTSSTIIDYLREKAPFYVYSNPITPSEAVATLKALQLLDSPAGLKLLENLNSLTKKLKKGIETLGFETIAGDHPIVPLMIRNTEKTRGLVNYLFTRGILATGLNYPVVPKGDEEIRFQVSAGHTSGDIEYLLETLGSFKEY